jgi:hypothetical protein
MTLPAVLSEPVLVYITVAIRAASVGNSPENLRLRSIPGYSPVAFGAFHRLVFSQKPEIRVVVVESGSRAEFVNAMAGGTICTQRPLVKVFMAVRALLPESQVGIGPFPELPVPNEFFFMTLAAIDPAMGPLKLIPSQGVIELFFIEADHLKIPAVVVVVTRGTFFSFHFGRNMIAFVSIDPGCNLLVAVQALFVGDLLSQHMTFNAIGHSFQVCMGLRKIPRTQLGKEWC